MHLFRAKTFLCRPNSQTQTFRYRSIKQNKRFCYRLSKQNKTTLRTMSSNFCNQQILPLLTLRANTSICPRLSAAIFVCADNVVKMGVFCIMGNFMLYTGTHSIGTCASLLHIIIIILIIIIIKPLLKIFNECRSLTGVGELNPYWRSSMNVEV